MNSKGFRDEDGNIITIPGTSVRYNPALNGHLAQFGEDGTIEDGGEKSKFAPASGSTAYAAADHDHAGVYSPVGHDHAGVYAEAAHTHTIANVTGLQAALDGKMKNGATRLTITYDTESSKYVLGTDAGTKQRFNQFWENAPKNERFLVYMEVSEDGNNPEDDYGYIFPAYIEIREERGRQGEFLSAEAYVTIWAGEIVFALRFDVEDDWTFDDSDLPNYWTVVRRQHTL